MGFTQQLVKPYFNKFKLQQKAFTMFLSWKLSAFILAQKSWNKLEHKHTQNSWSKLEGAPVARYIKKAYLTGLVPIPLNSPDFFWLNHQPAAGSRTIVDDIFVVHILTAKFCQAPPSRISITEI